MTRRTKFAIVALLSLVAFAPTVTAFAQEHFECGEALREAKGKYMSCFGKAAAKAFSPDSLQRCRERYAATWPRVQERYPGTSCDQSRFEDNGDGTVSDYLTGLVWEKKDSADLSWDLANRHDADNQYSLAADNDHPANGSAYTDFLANLNSTAFAGQRDWRIPLLAEALTIVGTEDSPCSLSPCVADPSLLPSADQYPTASPSDRPAHNYMLVVDGGYALDPFRTVLTWTRAVRGAF